MSGINKLLIFLIILFSTLAYVFISKKKIQQLSSINQNIEDIKIMPKGVQFADVQTQEMVNINSIVSDFKEGLVFIHFWATWCGPCEEEFKAISKLINKSIEKKNNVLFLLVAVNDDREKVIKFFKRYQIGQLNVKFLIDNSGVTSQFFHTVKLPETYVFKGQTLLEKFVGPQSWDSAFFSDLFNQ